MKTSERLAKNSRKLTKQEFFIGIDQHGEVYNNMKHPRKELMERIGSKHSEKMYQDIDGKSHHVGYVIGGHWVRLYIARRFAK
jgi:hypothetical protein